MTIVSVSQEPGRARTIADYFEIVRRYKLLIALATIVVPLIAYFVSTQQAKIYEASAEVLLSRQDLGSVLTGLPTQSTLTEPERYARTQAALARVPAVAALALRRAGVTDMSPRQLIQQSSVTPRNDTDLLTFSVRDRDPERAAALATAYANAFASYKLETETSSIRRANRELRERLRELRDSGGSNTEAYRQLLQKSQDLRTLELLQVPASLVRAAADADQVEPRPKRNAALGMMLGLLLGLGSAYVLNALDRRIRDVEEIERELGVPLLARIPAPRGRGEALTTLSRAHDEVTDAIGRLRANFDFANTHVGAKVVMVTSALAREGKSTTVANLAIALARTGRHVVLVDLDLRRPALARLFQLADRVGVSDIAVMGLELESALNPIPHTPPRAARAWLRSGDTGSGILEVLTAGRARVDPADFVETPALANVLQQLRTRAEIVLVDSSPLLAAADAMALTAKVDAILLVNRVGTLTRPALRDLRRALDRSPAPTMGFVATGVAYEETYYYGYRVEDRAAAEIAPLRAPAPAEVEAVSSPPDEPRAAQGRWARPSSKR